VFLEYQGENLLLPDGKAGNAVDHVLIGLEGPFMEALLDRFVLVFVALPDAPLDLPANHLPQEWKVFVLPHP